MPPPDGHDIAAYDYELPESQIAQAPLPDRSNSRLLVVDRAAGTLAETRFDRIGQWLSRGDVLVRNDTRVIPARIRGVRLPDLSGFEATLFEESPPGTWKALVKPAKKLKPGTRFRLGGRLEGRVIPVPDERLPELLPGEKWLELGSHAEVMAALDAAGEMPLPPYVKAFGGDPARYQTIYARTAGAIAAPTAGFHFTPGLFEALKARGVEVVDVTLHVGPGTFQPVRTADYEAHRMLPERFRIDLPASRALERAVAEGRRIVAVGSTSLRLVETLAQRGLIGLEASGATELYCTPGYRFRAVGALITNLHLPRTTLLLLVMAFGGEELMRRAYARAVADGFRFYSFGDAMIIV